jgi:hypothetical protein
MWEYKRSNIKFRLYTELNDELNKEGNNNWEVIYYLEEKAEKYCGEFIAHILYKRLKTSTS